MKKNVAKLGLMLTLSGVALAACSTNDGGNGSDAGSGSGDDQTIKAVATTTQICDYLTQIAQGGMTLHKVDSSGKETTEGDGETTLDLTCLLAPNASAHEHEMTPQQMSAMADADFLFKNGVDLEHFLDNAVESSGFDGETIVTAGDDNSKHKVDLREWPFPGEDGEEPEFTHDPHVWTSPKNAKIQVENIVDALADKEPSVKEVGEKYTKQLDELDKWVTESLETVPEQDRALFTSHDAFGYFSNDYDVKFIGSALTDFNNQQDATSSHIEDAAKEVRDSGAKAIFAENSNNSKSIEAIARAAGVKAIMDDDALYGDSLGVPNSDGATYIGSIIHNVTTLVDAWDGEAADLPESLDNAR